MERRIARPGVVVGAVLMALTLAAAPVSAEYLISETGLIGPYQINDFESGPRGATCLYHTGGAQVLDMIKVKRPFVHSRNRGPGNQTQWVGWRFIIQRDNNFDAVFETIYRSSFRKATASETVPAPFTNRSWTAGPNPQGNYRVLDVIKWYKPGTNDVEQGRAVNQVEWYYAKLDSSNIKERHDSCYRDYPGS